MTLQKLVQWGSEELHEVSGAEAHGEARQLLFTLLHMDLQGYALHLFDEADREKAEAYADLIRRRKAHEPLQYITGRAPFFGYEFSVNPDVLIPRFDTETLVMCAIGHLKEGDHMLDLCTGSGCVLIAALLEGPEGVKGTGVDLSPPAVETARRNAQKHAVTADIFVSDLFENVQGTFQVITANPPYITPEVISTLAPEVKDHEPHMALCADGDGLGFYRRIAAEAPRYLEENGLLAVEIGFDQAGDVEAVFKENGFWNIRCVRDLAGRDRVVCGEKKI
jgi:release factor glutamine methyltransferase